LEFKGCAATSEAEAAEIGGCAATIILKRTSALRYEPEKQPKAAR